MFHDYGWLRYETAPLLNPATERPYQFLELPFSQEQTDAYQWCIDWLTDIDPLSGLIVSMHRTGLWKNRYDTMVHPSGKYDLKGLRPEIQALIDENEVRQQRQREEQNETQVWTNYRLLQVWDLLGLYFCCQEPYDDYIEPVPVSFAGERGTDVRMTMTPKGDGRIGVRPLPLQRATAARRDRLPAAAADELPGYRDFPAGLLPGREGPAALRAGRAWMTTGGGARVCAPASQQQRLSPA